jgi:hypothetical protein
MTTMARFTRPAGAIDHYAKIKKWDVLWHVYGIVRPFMDGPLTVVRPPYLEGDSIRFDLRKPRFDYVDRPFASDGNLLPDHSHNDNYWFFTEREAQAAKSHFDDMWEANPELRQEELDRRAERAREDRDMFFRAYAQSADLLNGER